MNLKDDSAVIFAKLPGQLLIITDDEDRLILKAHVPEKCPDTILSVNLLCKALKVAKGSYYNHILRNKNENTIFEQKKKELTPIIEQIFHDNNQIYGASKVHAILSPTDQSFVS